MSGYLKSLDGIAMSTGFDHLSTATNGIFNATLSRCSILTQKSGEQRRLSNVPETISKSATALNIRVAELSPHSTNATSKTMTTQRKAGKRQSILNMVVKPAATPTRRPSCPTLSLQLNQNKFGIRATTGASTPNVKQPNVLSMFSPRTPQTDLRPDAFTLTRLTPKFQFEPQSPMVTRDTCPTGNLSFANGLKEHDNRWRFPDSNDDQQCAPALPSRVPKTLSNDLRRETNQVTGHYRNSMEEPMSKGFWRNSDFLDEDSDEGSRDPDYDLPKYNHDEEDTHKNGESEADIEDEYSYPQYNYASDVTDAQLQHPLSVVEETENTNDSYDYLPGCRGGDRMSTGQSSCQLSASDDPSFNDYGIYDTLPKRSGPLEETETKSIHRMSGLETTSYDGDAVYQNDVFSRSPVDTYDFVFTKQVPEAGGFGDIGSILPPLPEKRNSGHKDEKATEKRRTPPLLPPAADHQGDFRCYVNSIEINVSKASTSSSLDEGVYLPMTGGKVTDTIYTPMHSPEMHISGPDSAEKSSKHEDHVQISLNGLDTSQAKCNQSSESSEKPSTFPCPAVVPIRFTANTRSFKRRSRNRDTIDKKEEQITTLNKHRENHEPSFPSNLPPPLPPKSRISKCPNYIHYASLVLEPNGKGKLPSPLSEFATSPGGGSYQTDTLYRLIDPEKTKALCDLKKQMEDDRQRNFGNLSPEH